MKKCLFIVLLLYIIRFVSFSQVGIGTPTPHQSAAVDITSTNKGALLPRMTTAQRKAIVNPAAGLLVFDLNKNSFYFFDGQTWRPLGFIDERSLDPISHYASDSANGDYFGNSVSINGDYAIIGSYLDDIGSNIDQGSAYIFRRTGGAWIQEAKLIASDGSYGDYFGFSVSISGDYAIVGAYHDDTATRSDQGSAYIFQRSGTVWIQQVKLWANDGASGDNFGRSVAITNDFAVVGSPLDGVGSNFYQGSIYIFPNQSGWGNGIKMTAPDGTSSDIFGFSVAASGINIVAGAIGDESRKGAVYVFYNDGLEDWYFMTKLTASDGVADDEFGYSLSIDGNYIIAGAPSKDSPGILNHGAAYVFIQNNSIWTQLQVLRAADKAAEDKFGNSVSINGDYIIVGANEDDKYREIIGISSDEGSAFLYKKNNGFWSILRKIELNNGNFFNKFGSSVSIYGSEIIIGSPTSIFQTGSVSFLNIE